MISDKRSKYDKMANERLISSVNLDVKDKKLDCPGTRGTWS